MPYLKGNKRVKHAVKWIADGPPPKALKAYLSSAPNGVIKSIINAALNVQQGSGIRISPARKKLFSQHRKAFVYLTNPHISFERKRHAIQKGGAFPLALLAPIVASAVATLGSEFIPKIFNRS